jgi:hypothetical protein
LSKRKEKEKKKKKKKKKKNEPQTQNFSQRLLVLCSPFEILELSRSTQRATHSLQNELSKFVQLAHGSCGKSARFSLHHHQQLSGEFGAQDDAFDERNLGHDCS